MVIQPRPVLSPRHNEIKQFLSRHPEISSMRMDFRDYKRESALHKAKYGPWNNRRLGYRAMSPAFSVRYGFWITRTMDDGLWYSRNEQPLASIGSSCGFAYALEQLEGIITTYPWKQWIAESAALGREVKLILYSFERTGVKKKRG